MAPGKRFHDRDGNLSVFCESSVAANRLIGLVLHQSTSMARASHLFMSRSGRFLGLMVSPVGEC